MQGAGIDRGRAIAHRHRLDVGDAEAAAEGVFLIAMELQRARAQQPHDLADLLRRVVAEQRDQIDQRRDGLAQRARLLDLQAARAVLGKHQADGIDAQFAGQAHVAGAGQAAELDAGTDGGGLHAWPPAVTTAGRFHSDA